MSSSQSKTWVVMALCVFGLVLVRTAWICDDAYISYRVVDNFVHGRGLVWNVGERVQAYTNALWVLLLSVPYFITRESYFTMLFASMAVSMCAVLLVAYRCASSKECGVLALAVLTVSRAFVDYSTSGLENPLTHVLLALFVVQLLRDGEVDTLRLRRLASIAALSMVNRMDSVLFYAPALLLAARGRPWKPRLTALSVGFLPFIAWEAFAVFYYGFPFPNTAYAKLGAGIARSELLSQGLIYLVDSLKADPVTPFAIASGVVLAFRSRSRRQAALAIGVLLYLVYTVYVGGDFMSGRFLAAPLFVSAVLIARQPQLGSVPSFVVVLGLVVLIGFPGRTANLFSGIEAVEYEEMPGPETGIVDERRYYYPGTGLLGARRKERLPTMDYRRLGLETQLGDGHVRSTTNIGFKGFFVGPEYHIVDIVGLSDPLLARLPAHYDPGWRIGHHYRVIPRGYVETLETGQDYFEDRDLARFYEQLHRITSGPLLSLARLKAIVRMNLGSYDHLIDVDHYRSAGVKPVTLEALNRRAEKGTTPITRMGLKIELGAVHHERAIEVQLRGYNQYLVLFVRDEEILDQQLVYFLKGEEPLVSGVVMVPEDVRERGYDEVWVFKGPRPRGHDIGWLKLVE